MKIINEEIDALIRHALTVGSGYLVGAGVLMSSDADIAVGGIATVLALIWSLLNKQQQKDTERQLQDLRENK